MFIDLKQVTPWMRALNSARATIGNSPVLHDPTDKWKSRMLLAEHSPIRLVEYDGHIQDIKQWITVHLVRHWLGFIPFVHSQRPDRRILTTSRDNLPQGSLNDMAFSVNAQALINISRKRLCRCAHPETRQTWIEVRDKMQDIDPIMASKMVPECIYRGFCPEMDPCGFSHTEQFRQDLEEYRKDAKSMQP